jgi:hypothetical protein
MNDISINQNIDHIKDMPYELEPAPLPPTDIPEQLSYELEPAPLPPNNISEPLSYEVKPISEIKQSDYEQNFHLI